MKSRVIILMLMSLSAIYCIAQSNAEKIDQYSVLAKKMESQMKYDSALMLFDSAIQAANESNDLFQFNFIQRKIAGTLIVSGNYDSAKVLLTNVWDFAFKNKIDTLRLQAENYLGWIFMEEKLMSNALNYYESALSIAEKVNDTAGLFTSYYNLSNYYNDLAEFNTSLDYALKALQIAESKKISRDEYMRGIINLGNVYEKHKLYDSALTCYQQVFEYSLQNKNNQLAFNSIYNKALIFTRLGAIERGNQNIEKSLEYYQHSKDLYEQLIDIVESNSDFKRMGMLYNSLGILNKKLGDFAKAENYYKLSLKYAELSNDLGNKVRTLKNMGMLYRSQGEYKIAEKYFMESLNLADSTGYKIGVMDAYNSLSVLYELKGDYKESNNYLSKYIDIYKSIIEDEKIKSSQEMLFLFEREKDKVMINDLENQNKISQLEGEKMKFERRTIYGVFSSLLVILLMVLLYLRMKSRKNRIINAQRIQQLEDEKKLLAAQSVMVGQENERKRIAQELHDGIGVLLSTASIHFSVVSKTAVNKKTIEMLNKAEMLLKQAGGEVRKISQNMMPVVLSKFGLFEALEDMFDKLDDMDELEVVTNFLEKEQRLPENTEIMLYRIIQEMVNNTLKHANANRIEFSCGRQVNNILIDYKDNGIGFDIENLPHNKSLGVFGIKSRIDFLKGKLNVTSAVGKGTHYQILIPIPA